MANNKFDNITSEEAYDLYNNSPCGYHSLNKDGVVVRINDTELSWLGYTRDEVVEKKKFSEFMTENSRKKFLNAFQIFLQTGKAQGLTFDIIRKDGSVFTVLANASAIYEKNGTFIMSRSTLVDITERKNIEENLEATKEYLGKIIDSVADPIFVKDREHKWVLLNDSYCSFMGYKREELIGKSDYDFFPIKEAKVFWEKDEEVFESGEGNVNEEFFTDASKITRTIITKKTLYIDHKGAKLIVGIIRDITELKRTTEELKTTYEKLINIQARLVQSEKMASLGQLAAGVAHEINNPVTYVLSNISAFQDYEKKLNGFLHDLIELSTNSKFQKQINELNTKWQVMDVFDDMPALVAETFEGVERIKKIVQDLRMFAHPTKGVFKYGDIHKCIDQALNIVFCEIKDRVRLIKEFGNIPKVYFQEQQMSQVFINLFVNAAQAIEKEGELRVKTCADAQYIHIEIADNGVGIPPDILPKIFDPFFTTKPVGQGTGLGLSVVHGIIEEHKGTINVESHINHGTTFRIKLPISNK
ncbi:MAG: PAS domain S-box protein [Candidatus Omnitrophica bacterium]|nr:PAS domain S-box protein [Candidatus Omnitrophota bacterium]